MKIVRSKPDSQIHTGHHAKIFTSLYLGLARALSFREPLTKNLISTSFNERALHPPSCMRRPLLAHRPGCPI